MKLVSIIMLCYKNFDKIDNSIKSIIEQNYENIEVVFCDDCSPNIDKSYIMDRLKILNKFGIRVIYQFNEENLGTVKNFNEGIKKSNGDIIIPLSSNDEFYNCGSVKSIVDFFENSSILIATSKRICKKNGNDEVYPSNFQEKQINKNLREYILKYGNFIAGANLFYKKEVFEKNGLFDEKYRLLEDLPFIEKCLKNNIEIGYIPVITLKYEYGGVSTAKNMNPILKRDLNCFYDFIISSEKEFKRYISFRRKKIDNNNFFKRVLLYIRYFDVALKYFWIKRKEKYGVQIN